MCCGGERHAEQCRQRCWLWGDARLTASSAGGARIYYAASRTGEPLRAFENVMISSFSGSRVFVARGFFATEWLAERAGAPALLEYYRLVASSPNWQRSFEEAFGLGVDAFYEAVEPYIDEIAPPLPHLAEDGDGPVLVLLGAISPAEADAVRADFREAQEFFGERLRAGPARYTVYVAADDESASGTHQRVFGKLSQGFCFRSSLASALMITLDCGESLAERLGTYHFRIVESQFLATVGSPRWLTGAFEEYARHVYRAAAGPESLSTLRRELAHRARFTTEPLRREETASSDEEPPRWATDALRYFAGEWLVHRSGETAIFEYYRRRSLPDEPWEATFEAIFGIAVDDFLEEFEAYRAVFAPPPPSSAPPPTPRPTSPPAATTAPTLLYDTLDATGAVATAGSYAFLSDPGDTATVITTYEGLRDGTARGLLIHTSDARGASQADLFAAVDVGDLFEWRESDGCWVRYEVTDVKPDPAGAIPRTLLGVEWFGYSGTGCSGALPTRTSVEFTASPADIPFRDIGAPVRWGSWLLLPRTWSGAVEPPERAPPDETPGQADIRPATADVDTTDLATAETHPLWRTPTLPAPSLFVSAAWGSEPCGGAGTGSYCSSWRSDGTPVGIYAFRHAFTPRHWDIVGTADGWTYEARALEGHQAVVLHSAAGTGEMRVRIWDESRQTEYEVIMYVEPPGTTLDTVIGIALSLVGAAAP